MNTKFYYDEHEMSINKKKKKKNTSLRNKDVCKFPGISVEVLMRVTMYIQMIALHGVRCRWQKKRNERKEDTRDLIDSRDAV